MSKTNEEFLRFACVIQQKVLPSNICLGLPHNLPHTPIPSQLQSHDAAHTPRQNGLATMNSLCSLGLPSFFLFPQNHVLCGNPISFAIYKKTGLHLIIHSPALRFQTSLSQCCIAYDIDRIYLFLINFFALLAYVHFLLYLCNRFGDE